MSVIGALNPNPSGLCVCRPVLQRRRLQAGRPALVQKLLTVLSRTKAQQALRQWAAKVPSVGLKGNHLLLGASWCDLTWGVLVQASPAEEAIADRQAGPAAEAAAGVEQQAGSAGSAGAQAVGSKRGPVGALLEGGGPGEDTTPELAVGTPVGRSKLFPVFRRRGDYKVAVLCLITEAEA